MINSWNQTDIKKLKILTFNILFTLSDVNHTNVVVQMLNTLSTISKWITFSNILTFGSSENLFNLTVNSSFAH